MASFSLSEFNCSITLDLPIDPVETLCGHLFERTALLSALRLDPRCPLCRCSSSPSSIRSSSFVARLLKPHQPCIDVVLDTLDTYSPQASGEMSTRPTNTLINALFSDYVINNDDAPRMYSYVLTTVLDDDNLFLAHSVNILMLQSVAQGNMNFLRRRHIYGRVDLYKFIYRTRLTIADAVVNASNHGYYVYDMYFISPNRYCLLTLPRRLDGSLHTLDPLV